MLHHLTVAVATVSGPASQTARSDRMLAYVRAIGRHASRRPTRPAGLAADARATEPIGPRRYGRQSRTMISCQSRPPVETASRDASMSESATRAHRTTQPLERSTSSMFEVTVPLLTVGAGISCGLFVRRANQLCATATLCVVSNDAIGCVSRCVP